jgi:hypothetical protein
VWPESPHSSPFGPIVRWIVTQNDFLKRAAFGRLTAGEKLHAFNPGPKWRLVTSPGPLKTSLQIPCTRRIASQVNNDYRSKDLTSPKPNSWNGEEVRRTRPSPAFRFLPFSPRRLCSHGKCNANSCLCNFAQFCAVSEQSKTDEMDGWKRKRAAFTVRWTALILQELAYFAAIASYFSEKVGLFCRPAPLYCIEQSRGGNGSILAVNRETRADTQHGIFINAWPYFW